MALIGILKQSFTILLLLCKLIGSKEYSPNANGDQKLSECRRCKVLTESFNHWLDKTSRGKYEGGDAAWEEAKLKSYARSEVRLVEIQEGLCSELKIHQDACYAVAEESEQVLEKWWFDVNSVSLDLYTWLCIETLQQCCPSNHYGLVLPVLKINIIKFVLVMANVMEQALGRGMVHASVEKDTKE
ncbi:hypothetical protein HF086_015785 [Spodoptera exigua]|uniref:DUF3456 domain-containing protein n=1 Tax=Spodoptera exigua TaxID=7107 RepID=A0A922M3J3_SPOEX|nr:hypothetical protein HF086_015785 [Spodoptera exigua]